MTDEQKKARELAKLLTAFINSKQLACIKYLELKNDTDRN